MNMGHLTLSLTISCCIIIFLLEWCFSKWLASCSFHWSIKSSAEAFYPIEWKPILSSLCESATGWGQWEHDIDHQFFLVEAPFCSAMVTTKCAVQYPEVEGLQTQPHWVEFPLPFLFYLMSLLILGHEYFQIIEKKFKPTQSLGQWLIAFHAVGPEFKLFLHPSC